MYRVETAAFKSKHPDAFENVLRREVEAVFDKKIYDGVLELESKKREKLQKIIDDFFAGLED